MDFRRGFKAEANRISLRVRAQMGLRPRDPIDPVEICRTFDIVLIALGDLASDAAAHFLGPGRSAFSAVTVPCGAQTAIVHNDAHHLYRQRSNISHELAHCFLRHEYSPPLTADGARTHDGQIEAEANFLAGALLIPNEAANHIVLSELEPVASDLYGVSAGMLEYRLSVSGARRIRSRFAARRGLGAY